MMSANSTPKRSNPKPTKNDSPVKRLRVKEYELSPVKIWKRKEKKVGPSTAESPKAPKNKISASRQLPEMTDAEVIEALSAEMSLGPTTLPAPYNEFFGDSEKKFIKGIREAVKVMEEIDKAHAVAEQKEQKRKVAVAIAKKRRDLMRPIGLTLDSDEDSELEKKRGEKNG